MVVVDEGTDLHRQREECHQHERPYQRVVETRREHRLELSSDLLVGGHGARVSSNEARRNRRRPVEVIQRIPCTSMMFMEWV